MKSNIEVGATMRSEHFIVPNRIGGQLSIWRYDGQNAKADIILLHDVTTHAGAFGDGQSGLVAVLCEHGFNVWTCDLHGYGNSWPMITRQTQYSVEEAIEGDLPLVIKTVQRHCELPLYVLGEGGGALLWQKFLADQALPNLAGAVYWHHPVFRPLAPLRWQRFASWFCGFYPNRKQRVVASFYRQLSQLAMSSPGQVPLSGYFQREQDSQLLAQTLGAHNAQLVHVDKDRSAQIQTIAAWLNSNFIDQ